MKLLLRIFCLVTIALAAVGLTLYLSAASLPGASALDRGDFALGLVNVANKLALIVALIGAMLSAQRAQWRWLIALVVLAIITVLNIPLGALTHTDLAIFFVSPFATALLALAYTYRMSELTLPSRAWWKAGSDPSMPPRR